VTSVAEQVPLSAQLRWLTALQQLGVSAADCRPAALSVLARAETAEAVLSVRRDQHHLLVRDTIAHLAAAVASGAPLDATVRAIADRANTFAPVTGHALENLVIDDPVTTGLVHAAPPAIQPDLARIAAAQAAITTLRTGHEVTAQATASRYAYYCRAFELSDAEARAATLLDMDDELEAVCVRPGPNPTPATSAREARR
jgi:hypothetical protein